MGVWPLSWMDVSIPRRESKNLTPIKQLQVMAEDNAVSPKEDDVRFPYPVSAAYEGNKQHF